jgi:hypothetical protein
MNNKVDIHFEVPSLLLVAFVVLKLTHVIDWSWVWVLAKDWIPMALVLVVLIVALIVNWRD